ATRRWLAKQRTAYRGGRLSPERQARLEQLPGVSWAAHEDRWALMYGLLIAFAAREGHARGPQGDLERGVGVGGGVNSQLTIFQRGLLEPDRIRQLEAVPGWSWSVLDDSWANTYELLRCYVAREGSARVEDGHVENGVRLGAWARKQRTIYRDGA